MIEKQFLEEVQKGSSANFDVFGRDIVDLLDWGIASSFVIGVSYSGYGNNINLNITNPKLTDAGLKFLNEIDGNKEEVKTFDTLGLLTKIKELNINQQEIIASLVDNIHIVNEIDELDQEQVSALKRNLIKFRLEDMNKEMPWDILIKLVTLLK